MQILNIKSLVHAATLLSLGLSLGCSDVSFQSGAEPKEECKDCPTPPRNKTDRFEFNDDKPLTKVDVLFVVDNSGSMLEEQQKLATRLSSFVDTINGIDWQIGITTTDIDTTSSFATMGRLVTLAHTNAKILTRNTPNYEDVFLDTITAYGTPPDCEVNGRSCPSGNEQPLQAMRLAVGKRQTDNAGFFRDGADFVSIVLSDEDEMSDGDPRAQPTTPNQVLATINSAWSGLKNFTAYGIIIKPGDVSCFRDQQDTGGNYGSFVSSLVQLTEGVTGSICDSDYGPTLVSIGQRVVKVATSITLTENPIPESVKVSIQPLDSNLTWELQGKTIRFNDLPKRGTRVEVSYQVLD